MDSAFDTERVGFCDEFETVRGDWLIRPAREDEFEAVREFVLSSHVSISGYCPEAKEHQENELEEDFPTLHDKDIWVTSKCWVCCATSLNSVCREGCDQDNEPFVGCVGLRHAGERWAEISFFFVKEAYRSIGVGRKLISHAINWVEYAAAFAPFPYNYEEITLCTLRKHFEKAYLLYNKLGFRTYMEKDTPYFTVVNMNLSIERKDHQASLFEVQKRRQSRRK
jgi:GNAT superfamily N-acetyltransferase